MVTPIQEPEKQLYTIESISRIRYEAKAESLREFMQKAEGKRQTLEISWQFVDWNDLKAIERKMAK